MESSENMEPVIRLDVTAAILRLVLQWAAFHHDDTRPVGEDEEMRHHNTTAWNADFLKVDLGTLFGLLLGYARPYDCYSPGHCKSNQGRDD